MLLGMTAVQSIEESAPSVADPAAAKPNGATGADRRSSQRRDYPYLQVIVPVIPAGQPGRGKSIVVECFDVSTGGVSFLLDYMPDFSDILVVLGTQPHVTTLLARIIRVSPTTVEGRSTYLVGCRFTRRA